MTSVQTMLRGAGRLRRVAGIAAALAVCAGVTGCAGKPELVPPAVLVSPYGATTGDVLWAVAPLANESATATVDSLAIGDALVAKIVEVQGLTAVPMNRTIAAMRSLGMASVRSVGDARRLAAAVGADGIIVGTITAYEPYFPPTIGLSVALFAREGGLGTRPDGGLDARALQQAYADREPPPVAWSDRPVSVVSEQLEGANQGVQMNVRTYAEGRHEPATALGWKRYLASMDLYTQFAAFWTVRRLLDEERLRLARAGVRDAAAARR